jgi:hypothetical protein
MEEEPKYSKGEIIYHKERDEFLHITAIYESYEHRGHFIYKVSDLTHTTYEQFHEQDLSDIGFSTLLAVKGLKPVEYFEKEELRNKIKNHKRFPDED